jgi:ribosomal protein L37AE/L43A
MLLILNMKKVKPLMKYGPRGGLSKLRKDQKKYYRVHGKKYANYNLARKMHVKRMSSKKNFNMNHSVNHTSGNLPRKKTLSKKTLSTSVPE